MRLREDLIIYYGHTIINEASTSDEAKRVTVVADQMRNWDTYSSAELVAYWR